MLQGTNPQSEGTVVRYADWRRWHVQHHRTVRGNPRLLHTAHGARARQLRVECVCGLVFACVLPDPYATRQWEQYLEWNPYGRVYPHDDVPDADDPRVC